MDIFLMVELSTNGAIAMTVIGILCFILAVAIIFLYLRNIKKRELEQRTSFQETTTKRKMKYEVFSFWTNYTYIFLIVVGFIAGIVLTTVGATSL